jgi:hypothetical protein
MSEQMTRVEKPLAKARRRLTRGQGVHGTGKGPVRRPWTVAEVDEVTREYEVFHRCSKLTND